VPRIKDIQGEPKILGQISGVSSSHKRTKKYMLANSFYVQPPRSLDSILQVFLSVGRLKALVFSVAIENEENLQQRVLRPVRPFATPVPRSYESVRQSRFTSVQVCIDWVGGYFEHFL
jgi:hypothetical protein